MKIFKIEPLDVDGFLGKGFKYKITNIKVEECPTM